MTTKRVLVGTCRTCGETIKLAMGDKNKQEIIEILKKQEDFSCPGHHVELSGPYPFHWNLDEWKEETTDIPNEAEFEAMLRKEFLEVRDTEGMAGLITGFAMGYPMTNDGRNWNFYQSPEGKRWYVTNDPKEG